MQLPTWKGDTVDPSNPSALISVLDDALQVLKERMDGAPGRSVDAAQTVRALEAASVLRFFAEAGQQLLVPIARTDGASWGDLGIAMGIPAATVRSRHEDGVALREECLREVRRPAPSEGFTPSDHDVVRHDDQPVWWWVGDLGLGIQYVRSSGAFLFAFGDDEGDAGPDDEPEQNVDEDTWRFAIGTHLGDRQADPADARPGESLAALKERRSA